MNLFLTATVTFCVLAAFFLWVWRRGPAQGEEINPLWLIPIFLFCWVMLTALLLTGPNF